MDTHAKPGERPVATVRAAIAAGALAVTACFGAAVAFAGQPAEAAEPLHGSMIQPAR